jgi:hypothetical protein
LSKVADGKEQPDMLMKTSEAIWQQQRSYTEEEMKLFASYFRELN